VRIKFAHLSNATLTDESTYFLFGIQLIGDKGPAAAASQATYFLIFVPVTT